MKKNARLKFGIIIPCCCMLFDVHVYVSSLKFKKQNEEREERRKKLNKKQNQ